MKLKLYGDLEGLKEGIRLLSKDLSIELAEDGLPLKVVARRGNIHVKMEAGQGTVEFEQKIHFFRALGLFIEGLRRSGSFDIAEEPQFLSNGVMLDVSRNAVLKVDSIKRILDKMALMGLNMLMLYAEDTYEIESRPYFGYMRGRYTREELKQCDDYADLFGIEMIPCIQTLAHLAAALKWDFADELKDTDDILLVGSDRTYEFIEEMIAAASAPFRSKRIHIGMDEAHNLGLGKYLNLNGFRNRFSIMNEHLKRVKEILDRSGLKPMFWSDMYFRLASKTGDNYYDLESEIPKEVIDGIPQGVQLVYWDYYNTQQDDYEKMIRSHKAMGRDVVFAGGVWTWNGICVNYDQTFASTNAALNACKKEGITEIFATMWGDDGGETSCFTGLLGLQLFAEHGYAGELDQKKLERRFEFCTGASFESFMDLSRFDAIPQNIHFKERMVSNPSKYLLWQDILTGLFDRHTAGMDLPAHFAGLAEANRKAAGMNGEWEFLFAMYEKLADVLCIKSEIGVEIKKAYDDRDIDTLKDIAQRRLPDLDKKVRELRRTHRDLWLKTCKPFGWEVIDIRYGGVISRIDTAIFRITQYLSGLVEKIDELEVEKLDFDGWQSNEGVILGRCDQYSRIASAAPM